MNIAVVTGSSSGLGKVFFEKVMERYPTLDEVWLIARREDKLKELANKYPNKKYVYCRLISPTQTASTSWILS